MSGSALSYIPISFYKNSYNAFSFSASSSSMFTHSHFFILCNRISSCCPSVLSSMVPLLLVFCYILLYTSFYLAVISSTLLVKAPGESLLWPLFAYCLFSHHNNHLLTFLPTLISILFFPNIRLFILSSTLAVNNSHPSSVHSTETMHFHLKATSSITFEIHIIKSSNI